jgi:hypothetical protein
VPWRLDENRPMLDHDRAAFVVEALLHPMVATAIAIAFPAAVMRERSS